jgi:hypothetical protein
MLPVHDDYAPGARRLCSRCRRLCTRCTTTVRQVSDYHAARSQYRAGHIRLLCSALPVRMHRCSGCRATGRPVECVGSPLALRRSATSCAPTVRSACSALPIAMHGWCGAATPLLRRTIAYCSTPTRQMAVDLAPLAPVAGSARSSIAHTGAALSMARVQAFALMLRGQCCGARRLC